MMRLRDIFMIGPDGNQKLVFFNEDGCMLHFFQPRLERHHKKRSPLRRIFVPHNNKNSKNVQQRGFASGHPPNY
jgi:hypothetical protein